MGHPWYITMLTNCTYIRRRYIQMLMSQIIDEKLLKIYMNENGKKRKQIIDYLEQNFEFCFRWSVRVIYLLFICLGRN